MPIAVNPVIPSTASRTAASEAVFVPGAEVTARVVQMLSENKVRITVGAFAYDLATTTKLDPGQILKLQVSAEGNLKLALIQSGGTSDQAALRAPVDMSLKPTLALLESVGAGVVSKLALTPQEAKAVADVAQSAAARQGSQAQLFADLGAASKMQSLPPQLQQAVSQVLAMRPALDDGLTGADLKSAMQQSGVMMEAALASRAATSAPVAMDMKAALTVFKQVASLFAQEANPASAPTIASPKLAAAADPIAAMAGQLLKASSDAQIQSLISSAATPAGMAGAQATGSSQLPLQLAATVTMPATLPPPPALPLPPQTPGEFKQYVASLAAAIAAPTLVPKSDASARAPNAVLTLAALLGGDAEATSTTTAVGAHATSGDGRGATAASSQQQASVQQQLSVAPPIRGALPQAQPMAEASLADGATIAQVARQLVDDADAALARTVLHQIASLPERVDALANRHESVPRLSFEIPFATAHGTALAQFEIARDGEPSEASKHEKTWQARFSLDIEPAGPVHALVMMRGEETMVRLWAERPETSEQLRSGARDLAQALVRAELKPGDISVREGAPILPADAIASGHFVDRAL